MTKNFGDLAAHQCHARSENFHFVIHLFVRRRYTFAPVQTGLVFRAEEIAESFDITARLRNDIRVPPFVYLPAKVG